MDLTASLKEFVEEGADWERKNTSVKGVSIIRLPQYKTRPASLAIDINPIGENGLPMKKKGVMIMSAAELQAFREVFKNDKLDNLIKTLEDVTGKKPAGKPAKADVVQI
jgi:uroporphyrinogen-III synthase